MENIFAQLSGEQHRQLIDTIQVFEAWRIADDERMRRFRGSMRWVQRNGQQYLLRKLGRDERSLGAESEATKSAFDNFKSGRVRNNDQLAGLAARLDQLAPVNKAMGLGRVPVAAARILRDLDRRDLLGHQLFVVGTNALFAYEARAGIRFNSELIATGDVDLLYDARQRLSLIGREVRDIGLLGILQRLDHSFSAVRQGGFRAVNRDGYLVDLIRPEARDIMRSDARDALSDLNDDLRGSPIAGLTWMINAPRFQAVAVAEDGYPVPLVCVDPRVFALHKLWVSQDPGRDPLKRSRDRGQAVACAEVATRLLGLSFDRDSEIRALPDAILALKDHLVSAQRADELSQRSTEPRW